MEELGHVYGWLVIACLLDFVFGVLLGFTVGVFTSLLSRLTREELHTQILKKILMLITMMMMIFCMYNLNSGRTRTVSTSSPPSL